MTVQNFNDVVGQAIQADTVNQVHHHHSSGRLLIKQERILLNKLVRQLEADHGESGGKTWIALHNIIGVDNIDAMTQAHFEPAKAILNLLLDKAKLQCLNTKMSQDLDKNAQALTELTRRNAQVVAEIQSMKVIHSTSKSRDDWRSEYEKAQEEKNRLARQNNQLIAEVETATRQLEQQKKYFNSKASQPCDKCFTHTRAKRRWRAVAGLFGTLLMGAIGVGCYHFVSAAEPEAVKAVANDGCIFEGKQYSLGSQSILNGKSMQCGLQAGKPGWSMAEQQTNKKKPPVRRQKKQQPETDEITDENP